MASTVTTCRSRRRCRTSRLRGRATPEEMTMRSTLLLVFLVAGCGDNDHNAPAPATQKPPVLEHATQQDLAHEVEDAERLGTWREVQHRWEGQTLTWTVTRKPILCHDRGFCVVAAFPMQRPAKQGWMP